MSEDRAVTQNLAKSAGLNRPNPSAICAVDARGRLLNLLPTSEIFGNYVLLAESIHRLLEQSHACQARKSVNRSTPRVIWFNWARRLPPKCPGNRGDRHCEGSGSCDR